METYVRCMEVVTNNERKEKKPPHQELYIWRADNESAFRLSPRKY